MTPDEDIIVTAAPVYHPLGRPARRGTIPRGCAALACSPGQSSAAGEGLCGQRGCKCFVRWQVSSLFRQAGSPAIRGKYGNLRSRMVRCAGLSPAQPTLFALSICRPGSWSMHLRTSAGYQLVVAGEERSITRLTPIRADAGSTALPISYLPASAIPADVLLDGRILV